MRRRTPGDYTIHGALGTMWIIGTVQLTTGQPTPSGLFLGGGAGFFGAVLFEAYREYTTHA